MHTNSVSCRLLADLMHTNSVLLCRLLADLMHTNSVLCRLFADSMHTLLRASVIQNVAARAAGARWRRRGPGGGGGRRPPVLSPAASPGTAKRRPGKAKRRPGKATRRPGKAMRRPGKAKRRSGKAMRRPGKAKLGAAPPGKAKLYACPRALEVLLPAATAAPRALRQGYNLFPPPAPSSSHDVHRVGRAGDREGSKRAGGRSAPRRAWETRDVARGLGPILCACVVTFPNACVRGDGG